MIQTWSRDGRTLGHGLVSQTIETMPNVRDPALEIVDNANRKEVLLAGPIRSKSGFKTSLIGQRIFKFQSAWYTTYDWLQYSVSRDAAFCLTYRSFGTVGK